MYSYFNEFKLIAPEKGAYDPVLPLLFAPLAPVLALRIPIERHPYSLKTPKIK